MERSASEDIADGVAALEAAGEHVIWVIFKAYNGAAIPICWRHSAKESNDTMTDLRNAVRTEGREPPFIWALPVSDVPRM